MIVVGGSQQDIVPVICILLVVCEDAEELFHLLVDPLGLAVGLPVVHCRGCQFNSAEVPELCCELHYRLQV
jgi:hypothetical protein